MAGKLKNNRIAGVYKLTNRTNGMMYIGQSVNLEHRVARYGRGDTKGITKLDKAFKEQGKDNFDVEYLFTTTRDYLHLNEMLDTIELFLIRKYDTVESGYNTRHGGVSGKHNETTKSKISDSLKGKVAGEDNGFYGHRHSRATIEKFRSRKRTKEQIEATSSANRGKSRPEYVKMKIAEANKKKVLQYSVNGKFIKEYGSLGEAAKSVNRTTSAITMCCKGKTKVTAGYKWEYKN